MKIKSIKILNDGMQPPNAEALFDKIASFGSYAFNKSHSVEYSLISYWSMYIKTCYPAEFYAASMTIQEDDDRLAQLVMDAQNAGIKVLPPDINDSSAQIEIRGELELLAPFQAIKGISENTANAIVELRKHAGGKFTKKEDWSGEVQKTVLGKAKINTGVIGKLDKLGAFASVIGGLPPSHVSRLKDRLELMPGFTVEAVKATRGISDDRAIKLKLVTEFGKFRECEACSLKGGVHVMPIMGKTPKFMVVFDSPNKDEESAKRMMMGDSADVVRAALKDAGISPDDGYYTTLVKSPKSGKMLSNEQINGCSQYLQKEIEILKPPVILVMGGNTLRFFQPSLKGNVADYAGKVIFDPKLDASIVVGLNPMQVYFDASKAKLIGDACQVLKGLIV
jgi:DNA polymerase-3 subunit alpha